MQATGTYTRTGTTYLYSFTLTMEEYYADRFKGRFEWVVEQADENDPKSVAYYKNRIGLKGTEYVQGTYEPETQLFTLVGIKEDDPYEVIALDEYYFKVDASGKLSGTTYSNGTKAGKIEGQMAPRKKSDKAPFSLEQLGPFDDDFPFSGYSKTPTLPWIKIYPEYPRDKEMEYFCTYIQQDKYLILVSSKSFEYQLKHGFYVDLWDLKSGKYLGRGSVSVSDMSENGSYYRSFTLREDWLVFDSVESTFYLSFYKGLSKENQNFIITAKLNQNLVLKKKDVAGAKEKKFKKIIDGVGKTQKFHGHYHKHGESGFDNGSYAFVGWPVVSEYATSRWSNITASITLANAQGIRSITSHSSGMWEIMLARPNPKAGTLLAIKDKPADLIWYLQDASIDPYYAKAATKMLLGGIRQASDFRAAYKELPSLKDSLQAKASKFCMEKDDKDCCLFITEKFPGTPSAKEAEIQLNTIENASLVSSIRFSIPDVLESRNFKDAKTSTTDYGAFIFDENLVTRGHLQYLVTVEVTNPTQKTLSFVAETDLGVVLKESANVLGFSASNSSKENHFIERAFIPDLKAGETRAIAFMVDLGYQDIARNSSTGGVGIGKQFEVRSKSVKAIPLKGKVQSIEASLIRQVGWYLKAQANYPGKFKAFEPVTGIKISQHPLDMRKQAFKKASSSDPFYKPTAPTEVSKALEGVWKGKYTLTNVAEFDVELLLTAMDGKYFEGFIRYTLSACKCTGMAVLYGESYYEEVFGYIDQDQLVMDRFGLLSDRFRIRTSVAICRGLEDSRGKELTNVDPNTQTMQVAWKAGAIWELSETDPGVKSGKKFNLQLWKVSSQAAIRKSFDAQRKNILEEQEQELVDKIKIKRVSSTNELTTIGVMVLRRELKNRSYDLFGIADPFNSVRITANGKNYKLKHYSGISIENSQYAYGLSRTSNVNCTECGALYRYFELYFEPVPASVQNAVLRIDRPDIDLPFTPSDFISEYTGLNEPLSVEGFAGFNMDQQTNYVEQRNPPNCKCFHPTTQELTDVWTSSNLNCKNGLVNGEMGAVNFPDAFAFSKNWINGKASGSSSYATRMHPLEPPKRLPTEQRNFQWVNIFYVMENNLIKTINDRQFGWQMGALMEAYVKTSAWLNDGKFESPFSGGGSSSTTDKKTSDKTADKPLPKACVTSVEEYGQAFLRCNAKVKDPYYKVRCGNGNSKYFFYLPVANSSGLCSDQKGYYELNKAVVNLGGFLGVDREKAIKKLCGCE
ncbi:MAG: hypothetical protein IT261_04885 [Saprospiraceae bacterium]|nr:hypothetical protein [Saprospiraceae bacterium]